MKLSKTLLSIAGTLGMLCTGPLQSADLSHADMENLVKRSYHYVALFNTLNNFAVNDKNPFALVPASVTGGIKFFEATGLT